MVESSAGSPSPWLKEPWLQKNSPLIAIACHIFESADRYRLPPCWGMSNGGGGAGAGSGSGGGDWPWKGQWPWCSTPETEPDTSPFIWNRPWIALTMKPLNQDMHFEP